MKLIAKVAVTFFMAITLISTIMLRATSVSEEYLASQSAFANQPNVIWYILIHLGMIMSFFTLNAAYKRKVIYGLTAFSSLFVLMLDMYGFGTLHNLFTAFLFGFASYCIIYYSNPVLKKSYFYVCLALGAVFATEVAFKGVLPIDIYQIETVIEWSFTVMLLINMYFFEKKLPKSL